VTTSRHPRAAISGIFGLVGFMLGSWFARLPQVRTSIGLSYAQLGTVLLAQTVGVLIAMQLAGQLAARADSRSVIRLTAVIVPWFPALLTELHGQLPAIAGMLGWGVLAGLLDVAMNTQGVAAERLARRPILNSLHAVWGIGALLGALGSAAAVHLGWSLTAHLGLVAVLLSAVGLVSGRRLLAEPPASAGSVRAEPFTGTGRRRPGLRSGWTRGIVLLGFIGGAAALCEGAAASWCGIFLQAQHGASAGLASLGYTAFIVAETGTRLIGDRLHHRLGAAWLVRASMAVSVLGVVLAVAVPQAWLSIAGFALLGCGLAVLVPIVAGSVGHGNSADGSSAATSLAIARYSTLHYTGVVIGPALVGWLAQTLGISTALWLLILPLAAIGALASATAPASVVTGRPVDGTASDGLVADGTVPDGRVPVSELERR
jgi:hypothetical protein